MCLVVYNFVVEMTSLFCHAVWIENSKELEGILPEGWIVDKTLRWIVDKTLRWPPVSNAKPYIEQRKEPSKDWKSFTIIKVKHQTGTRFPPVILINVILINIQHISQSFELNLN